MTEEKESKVAEIIQKMSRQRAFLTWKLTFNIDILFTVPSYLMPLAMLGLAFLFAWLGLEEVSGWAMALLVAVYLGLVFTALGAWFYADWRKRGVGQNRHVAKVNLKFAEPNSTIMRGGFEHTLAIEANPLLSAISPVKELVKALESEFKDQTFDEIIKRINKRLPTLDGKQYVVRRWAFPDTPFPDLVQKGNEWVKGGKGTPVNADILVFAHEDFSLANEAFDFFKEPVTTFMANYESDQPAYIGELILWEFYDDLQVWIATPDGGPEQRTTLKQVRPDDKVREFATITEFLRVLPAVAGGEVRIDQLLEVIQTLVRIQQTGRAMSIGIEGLNPGYLKRPWYSGLSEHKWLVIIIIFIIAGLFVMSLSGWNPFG